MTSNREKMNKAIQEFIVPVLREKGFTGTFPHFRRHNGGFIDLLTFQFDKYGGGFVVEIAKCSAEGVEFPNKVTAHHVNDKRPRLSPTMDQDYWFRFDKKLWFGNIYIKVAKEAVSLISDQAERWWADSRNIGTCSF